MTAISQWSRRRFLKQAATLATLRGVEWPRLWAATLAGAPGAEHTRPGQQPRPLLNGQTARPRRYAPDENGFLIRNGREFFNRPLYGAGRPFVDESRVDAGDLPEFSIYLPGHGGNLRVGARRGETARWAFAMADVTARYAEGRMMYEIRDEMLLDRGTLTMEVQTSEDGVAARIEARGTPRDLVLLWAFGGGDGRRGRCGGDIGCEDEPTASFFQLDQTKCAECSYKINGAEAIVEGPAGHLHLTFPEGTRLHLALAEAWSKGWNALAEAAASDAPAKVLAGWTAIPAEAALYLQIDVPREAAGVAGEDIARTAKKGAAAAEFATRRQRLRSLATGVRLETPDAYLAPAVSAMLVATQALWSPAQGIFLEGGVAERVATPGWRGPYALDALGQHDSMREHLRFWLGKQNQGALPPDLNGDEEVQGSADAGSHLTRKETLLHTNGDVWGGHQDRNLAFFDALMRHLRWTGDAAFAREIWPSLLRHMDWQYRLFRRVFPHPDHDAPRALQTLPLYESYACVPSSENLQYNGGGVAHSTAYNYFLNCTTATVARLLNEDPVPFDEEAALIHEAMQRLLWSMQQGAFAEALDRAYPQTVFRNPALWTISRTLDAELPTPRQAWQMCSERLAALRRIPVDGTDVPQGGFLLPSSDWSLAEPALNRLSMAENVHFALALWQAGLPDEAYPLLRGNLLDSMYQGLCPGNFHVTSALDPHRGETQRDAGDPLGITARALVEGLFGVLPDMMRGTLTIRPGFPSEWTHARLTHPDIDVEWRRDGLHETFTLTSRLPQPVALTLLLPARSTADPLVLSNGHAYPFAFDPNATGTPRLVLTNFPPATAWQIDVRWRGKPPMAIPEKATYRVGDRVLLPAPLTMEQIDDPQGCLNGGIANRPGQHAVFVHVVDQKCGYWLPIPLEIVPGDVTAGTPIAAAERYDAIDLSQVLNSNVPDLLRRSYTEPRSAFCSLALPEHLLGGWKDDDVAFAIDDAGLRAAGGLLKTAFGIPFVTPSDRTAANCRFLSFWKQDSQVVTMPLGGKAHTLYLLMTGTTFPQALRTEHGAVTVRYADGTLSRLALTAPETWWPVQADYLTDDYLFRMDAARPLPPRVDLQSGRTRLPEHASFKGKGGPVPGGAATVLHLPLFPDRDLVSVRVECSLYGVVVALLGITLGR